MTGQVLAMVLKDLTHERRSRASLNALIFFAALVLIIVSFALGPNHELLRKTAPAVLWISLSFASVLAFARAYQIESENGCFEGLILMGARPVAIYLGKLISTGVVLLVVEIVAVIALVTLDGFSLSAVLLPLAGIMMLGTIGVTAVGVLYGRLVMSLRAREVMLPLLMLPVILPALLASVKLTSLVLTGDTTGLSTWIELLVVFDVVFVTGGVLTYGSLTHD